MANPVLRGEMWGLSFGPQFLEAALVNVCHADGVLYPGCLTYMPGTFENATLPDPEISIDPRWGYGSASYRNWYNVFLGKTSFSGSIGDMSLMNGIPLRFPIGPCATTPSDAGTLGTTLNGATTPGALSIVTSADSYATNDILCIGEGTVVAESRSITRTAPNTYTVNYPLCYNHATGAATPINKHGTVSVPNGYYTHVITDGINLSPIQISVVNTDSDLVVALMRRYIGAKIGRASYQASEGSELRMSWEEILVRNLAFKDAASSASVPFYSTNIVAPTIVFLATDPYYFSQGALTFAGTPWARVREFTLDVSNNLEPKYYINSTGTLNRIPYELREGKKEYGLRMNVDIIDSAFYLDLLRMGTYTTFKGFQVIMSFTRGVNDSITFTMPANAPAVGGDSQGCFIRRAPHNIEEAPLISVPLDILTRNLQITVKDQIMVYP